MNVQSLLSRLESVKQTTYGAADYMARCPAHADGNPSLHISLDRDRNILLHCFAGCPTETVVETLGLTMGDLFSGEGPPSYVPPAKKDWKKPTPPPSTPSSAPHKDKAWRWLETRGILPTTARNHGITGDNRALYFPFMRDGEHINTQTRFLDPDNPSIKGFKMEEGCEITWFGLDDATRCAQKGAKKLVLVEGLVDWLTVKQALPEAPVLSVPNGASAREMDWFGDAESIFQDVDRVVVAVDSDGPGQKLEAELIRRIGPEMCQRVKWPEDCNDANDTLVKHGEGALLKVLEAAYDIPIDGIISPLDLSDEFLRLYRYGLQRGLTSGWKELDPFFTLLTKHLYVITGVPGAGKALALDTPIPTPNGYTTMGDLQVGDEVFDEFGITCNVIGVTEVMEGRPCYRMTFSDGTSVVCDEQHEWFTRDDKARRSNYVALIKDRLVPRPLKPKGNDQSHKRTYPRVRTTGEIAETLTVEGGKRRNHSVPVTLPLYTPELPLPIHPYVLGAWLGDGTSESGGFTCNDPEIIANIESSGFGVTKWKSQFGHNITGIKGKLRDLGVLNNKHIPTIYLRASQEQRLDLLQGLMDTDGYATKSGVCEFTSMNCSLAIGVKELATSLGMIPTMSSGRAMLNGRDCGEKYRVRFAPSVTCFRLPRKAERITTKRRPSCGWRTIVSCEPVNSVPVRCIQVDSPNSLYLCTHAMIPTHNSSWLDALAVNTSMFHNWKWAMFSPESSPIEEHLSRWAELYVDAPFFDGPTPKMTEKDALFAQQWAAKHLRFLAPVTTKLDDILEMARIEVRRNGINALVIDPWNEVDDEIGNQRDDRYLSAALRKVRRFAEQHDIAIFIVNHPHAVQKERDSKQYPVIDYYDLYGGSMWANKSSVIVSIWRDSLDPTKPVQLHIKKAKTRRIGKRGMVTFHYNRVTGRYTPAGEGDEGGA